MKNIQEEDLEKLLLHMLRIELKNGSTLYYEITAASRKFLFQFLADDSLTTEETEFLWFYIPPDRLVFINLEDVVRITFCYELAADQEPSYYDNFFKSEIPEAELGDDKDEETSEIYLPGLIVAHNRRKEDTEIVKGVTMKTEGYYGNISSYSELEIGQVGGFYFVKSPTNEVHLTTQKYLTFFDDDGELNFMPLRNLSIIEIDRPLLMSDELLDIILERAIN